MSATIAPENVTGQLIARRRKELGLSRESFAQRVGLTPGAVWRIEAKQKFKPGEVEHLVSVVDAWLGDDPQVAQPRPQPHAEPAAAAPPKVASVPTVDSVDDDGDIVQWLDPTLAVEFREADPHAVANLDSATLRQKTTLDTVLPARQPSPTELSREDGKWRISNSEIQTFKRCRRKWWLTYHRGLRPAYEPPFGARSVGSRGHLALQAWYRPNPADRIDPRDALEVIIADERRKVEELVAAGEFEPEFLTKFNANAELERVIIEGYVQWLEETGADSEYEVVGSEEYAEAPIEEYDGDALIVARLDVRLRRLTDDVRLFMDHKFVGSIREATKLLPLNEQMLFYMLIENLQKNDEPPVAGALYNMLRRVKRTARATPPFYERVEVHHNVKELASFRKRVVGVLDDINFVKKELEEETPHQLIVYPTPTKDCTWDCPFVRVCPMFDDGSRVEDALEAHFVKSDPYGYYHENSIEKTEE